MATPTTGRPPYHFMRRISAHPLPSSDALHIHYLELSLLEAQKCIAEPTAFSVGSIIVSQASSTSPPRILSTGYSRELPGNTHAEANAIDKFISSSSSLPDTLAELKGASIYTTMEPCSVRLSGNVPCVRRVIEAGFGKVIMGVEEPTDFVECEGTRMLKEAGIEVLVIQNDELRARCLKEARRPPRTA